MSEEQKEPETSGNSAISPQVAPLATEPAAAAVVAPAEPAKGATAEIAVTEATPATLSVPDPKELETWNEQVRRRMLQKTRRSFLGLGVSLAAGAGALGWLTTRREIDGAPWPLRKTLEINEQLARDCFSRQRLAPRFDANQVSPDRVNGDFGLDDDVDLATWNKGWPPRTSR